MAALKQTIHDKAYEEGTKAFAYITATKHPNWDLAYLGGHLADQITEWHAELQANQPPTEERHAGPYFPVAKPPAVPPPPPPEVFPEQVIEGNQEPVARAVDSDGSIEQIDNPDGVLDRQE